LSFQYRIQTRYAETGQDGIIHHSSYVVYLEEARIEFFKSLGCHINLLEQEKIFCPVVDLSVQYLKPLHSLEEIFVEVTVAKSSRVRLCLNYRIFRNNICIAQGSTSHCFVNVLFKPIAIPLDFFIALQALGCKEKILTSN
jgi:acyl-CoA thioester hydrolase